MAVVVKQLRIRLKKDYFYETYKNHSPFVIMRQSVNSRLLDHIHRRVKFLEKKNCLHQG